MRFETETKMVDERTEDGVKTTTSASFSSDGALILIQLSARLADDGKLDLATLQNNGMILDPDLVLALQFYVGVYMPKPKALPRPTDSESPPSAATEDGPIPDSSGAPASP